jgi:CRP-like cAMP-binding protein
MTDRVERVGMPADEEPFPTGDEAGELVRLDAGEVLFREGDPADRLFVVHSGEVEVQAESAGGRARVMATVGPGEVIGECGVLAGEPRNATVVARTDAILWAVSRQSFLTAAELGHPWAVRLLLAAATELAERLRTVAAHVLEADAGDAGERRGTAELQRLRDRLVEWSF